MRSKSEKRTIGEKRIISKFLIFPTTIDAEMRWFEYANIQQIAEYDCGDTHFGFGYIPKPTGPTTKFKWVNFKWVD